MLRFDITPALLLAPIIMGQKPCELWELMVKVVPASSQHFVLDEHLEWFSEEKSMRYLRHRPAKKPPLLSSYAFVEPARLSSDSGSSFTC